MAEPIKSQSKTAHSNLPLPFPLSPLLQLNFKSHHISYLQLSQSSMSGCVLTDTDFTYMRAMMKIFKHEGSREFKSVKTVLAIFCAALQPPSASLIAAALEDEMGKTAVVELFLTTLSVLFYLKIDTDASQMTLAPSTEWGYAVISLTPEFSGLAKWLTSTAPERMGKEFWIDASIGHNFLCALYLKYCGNKSVGQCLFRMIEVFGLLCDHDVIQ